MIDLTYENNKDEIRDLLSKISREQYEIVLWQKPSEEGQQRQVLFTKLESTEGELVFSSSADSDFKFEQAAAPIFFYCEEAELIFKSPLIPHDSGQVFLEIPTQCKLLSNRDRYAYAEMVDGFKQTFLDNVGRIDDLRNKIKPRVSLSKNTNLNFSGKGKMRGRGMKAEKLGNEVMRLSANDGSHHAYREAEEEKFAEVREAPRAKPKIEKKVMLRKSNTKKVMVYPLFDLSQGGLSFTITVQSLFQKGDIIEIVNLDDKPIDPPLKGKVMSIREIANSTDYKVGVMFMKEMA